MVLQPLSKVRQRWLRACELLLASHRGLTSGCLRAGFGDCDCSVSAEQTGQCGKARAIHQGSLTANVHYPAIFEKWQLLFGDVVYGWVAAGILLRLIYTQPAAELTGYILYIWCVE